LASASGGSVARALAEEAGEFEADREAALGVLQAARAGAVGVRLKAAAALATHRTDRRDRAALGMRVSIVQSLLRDLGVIRTGANAAVANADLDGPLRDLARAFDVARLVAAFETATRADDALSRNASPKVVADWIALSI
jgi:hypothetical protein